MQGHQSILVSLKQATANFPEELSSLLGITVQELTHSINKINEPGKVEILHSLTKAMHFNEKLQESAVGADSTLHQCIADEVAFVIKSIR